MKEQAYSKGTDFPEIQKDRLRLYSMRFCPFAQRTRLVLAHKGIPYETINIDLASKPSWFLERNPKGQVPVLQKNGKVITESRGCNEYLDQQYPEKRLQPEDPAAREPQTSNGSG